MDVFSWSLSKILYLDLSDLLLIFLHKVFIKTVQVQQLAIKMLIDLGVSFKDSKGKNKVILTILLEIMYSV